MTKHGESSIFLICSLVMGLKKSVLHSTHIIVLPTDSTNYLVKKTLRILFNDLK